MEHDGGAGISSDLQHEDLCRLCAVPGPDMDVGLVKFSVCGNTHECQLRAAGHRQGRDTVHRRFDSEVLQRAHGHDCELHTSRGFPLPVESGKHITLGQQPGETLQRSEAPDLFRTCRLRMIGDVPRRGGVQVRCDGLDGSDPVRCCSGAQLFFLLSVSFRGRHQPTAPSICSSMSRLSSRAYSMGSSLAMGSTKPRTIMAIASSSSMPRDMR